MRAIADLELAKTAARMADRGIGLQVGDCWIEGTWVLRALAWVGGALKSYLPGLA